MKPGDEFRVTKYLQANHHRLAEIKNAVDKKRAQASESMKSKDKPA